VQTTNTCVIITIRQLEIARRGSVAIGIICSGPVPSVGVWVMRGRMLIVMFPVGWASNKFFVEYNNENLW
jgi:hypothetical protein